MKNRFKQIVLALVIVSVPLVASAHDEGPGPKLADVGVFGGVVTAVVKENDRNKGAHANLVCKAELVRSNDGTVRVYIYDTKMKPHPLSGFSKKAQAVLISFVDGKEDLGQFDLDLGKMNFQGKAPDAKSKPFNIDIVFEEGGVKYLAAFDNLD